MKRKQLKEEKLLRDTIIEECGGMPLDIKRHITALVKAVQEDICQQVVDAIKPFSCKTRVKLMDAIMRYEKPKDIRRTP